MDLFVDYDWKQDNLQLVLDSPFGTDYLLARKLIVEESLSQPFRCKLSMVTEHPDLDPTKILGKPMSVRLKPPPQDGGLAGAAVAALLGGPESRYFHGIVTVFRAGAIVMDSHGAKKKFQTYNAEFIPRFGLLQYSSNCRIFQEKTVLEIIDLVLEEHNLSSGSDYSTKKVTGPLTKRTWDYCVQYNETDLQFLSRLMEEVGIYYYFKHKSSSHKLIMTDEESLSVSILDKDSIKKHQMVFQTASGAAMKPDEITSWENRYLFQSGAVALGDFDYRKTDDDLTTSETTSKKGHSEARKFELFHYPVPYQTSKADKSKGDEYGQKSDGGKLAEIQMQVLDTQRHLILGSSVQRELLPGDLIEIYKQKRGDHEEGDKFLVLSVRHEAHQEPLRSSTSLGNLAYANTFRCIPSKTPYRPPRMTPRPRMSGPQTAIVIGAKAFTSSNKSDQEIMTDKFGRVKVQFPWDRREGETRFETSSCWIRVAQGAAGAGWGMINVPRKGEEVIVDFIDGDPNQPIITGRVYNGQNANPYGIADDKPAVVLVAKKADKPYLSGFKSCSGKDGKPDKNYNELRFQDLKGKEHIYFHAEKDFMRVVENKDVLLVSDKETISDKRIKKALDDTVEGSQTIEVHKDRTITIQKGDQTLTVEEGKRTTKIKKNDELEVTEGDRKIEIKKGEHTLDVAKDITVTSKKNISIQATDSKIELKVGQSSITMKNDGTITVKGKTITLDAIQNVDIKAKMKVAIEGTAGVDVKGAKVANKGTAAASLDALTTEVKGTTMVKVQGPVTMIN